MICEFCIAMSGRFNAYRECCQIRLLAGAPAHARQEVFDRVKAEGGEAELAELMQKARIEYRRQRDHRAAVARQLREQETAKGRQASAALLQTMKEMKMKNVPVGMGSSTVASPVKEAA